MNKNEKLMVFILGALLIFFLGKQYFAPKQPAPAPAPTAEVATTEAASATQAQLTAPTTPASAEMAQVPAILPEAVTMTLENESLKVTVSSFNAAITEATFKHYKAENTDDSAPVTMPIHDLLALGFQGHKLPIVYSMKQVDAKTVTLSAPLPLTTAVMERTLTLADDGYALTVSDKIINGAATEVAVSPYTVSVGTFADKADVLAVGAYDVEEEVATIYSATSMGCSCSCTPSVSDVPVTNQGWLALSNRFFVSLVAPQHAQSIATHVTRPNDAKANTLLTGVINCPALQLAPNETRELTARVYLGPKEYEQLSAFADNVPQADKVMDFGFFGWFSKLLLWALNLFYAIIPNYGIAIILLTILVRIIFWPLTHKSTIAMRKMTEIQPMIKEIQQKFKGNPQKIQQETFLLYRQYKVNPLASCLPMLVQIPIFIAFFTMLRSVVELRFASFLWISDLSQPENLFAGVFPVALNILPILTAVTMGLQTHLSPSAGDPAQKKMMTWMMPCMMLFIFYSMPSALCLYWTVSQVLSILQMVHIRRKSGSTDVVTVKAK